MKKTNRWKHVSAKKMSARERGIFVDKKPSSGGGLEFSKAGCCFLTNDVLCLESGFSDKCPECSTYKRIMQEMEDEDLKMDAEIEEEMRK
jgi:hypothetical protein